VALAVTQGLNVVLVPRLAHAGLALAIALGACLNALLLLIVLYKRGVYPPAPGWHGFGLRLLAALAVLAGLCPYADGHPDTNALQRHSARRVGILAGVLGASVTGYFGILFLCGFRPRDFTRRAAPRPPAADAA